MLRTPNRTTSPLLIAIGCAALLGACSERPGEHAAADGAPPAADALRADAGARADASPPGADLLPVHDKAPPADLPGPDGAPTPDSAPQPTGICAAPPPPGAKAAGLTKLDFCDDFGDPGTFDLDGTLAGGFKWYRVGLPFGRPSDPKSAFKHKGGVLEVTPTKAGGNEQLTFMSAVKNTKTGKIVGYYIDRALGGFYVEARLSHNAWSGSSGFFAFWAMDLCHLYGFPAYCDEYFEPDFYEYINAKHNNSFHYWGDDKTRSPNHYKIDKCISADTPAISKDKTKLNVFGARFTPAGASYFFNDKAIIQDACASKAWTTQIQAGPAKLGTKTGRYPIMIGAGVNQPFSIDWVRVWIKP